MQCVGIKKSVNFDFSAHLQYETLLVVGYFATIYRAPQLLHNSFFGTEFDILKWNFHVPFPLYFNVNYRNNMEFYVKFAIFSILK